MACSCKKKNDFIKKITNQRAKEKKKNSILTVVSKPLMDSVMRILILVLFIVMIPIVILFFGFNYLIKGDLNIILPKSMQKFIPSNE